MSRSKYKKYSLSGFIDCQMAAIAVYVRQIPSTLR